MEPFVYWTGICWAIFAIPVGIFGIVYVTNQVLYGSGPESDPWVALLLISMCIGLIGLGIHGLTGDRAKRQRNREEVDDDLG